MRIIRLSIDNFRGVKHATLLLPKHGVVIGDNNTGKTTVLEALDLVLGPDRLNRVPPISEHDFFNGRYFSKPPVDGTVALLATDAEPPQAAASGGEIAEQPRIQIEAVIVDLSLEQRARFGDHIEFWDSTASKLYDKPNPAGVDAASIAEALRVTFHGWYDEEEDDFEGRTYFSRSLAEAARPEQFSRKDKQLCGFLYLRTIRTGSRALSLERGSLLDIILRLKEVRPQMWEDTLGTLSGMAVASDPALGISPVLESINTALKKYVPKEWGVEPHLKVSDLTREHLRKVVTAFIATGDGQHAAPFYRQGTGTINMLVLAMLSQIAESKQNVIFAMEEPETAIPPYAQKRIVHEVRKLASQTLFTSHSPYVLEEFTTDETLVLARDAQGMLAQRTIELPDNVKPKRYRQEFRTIFCEGLLARRVLVAEGPTEASAFPVACRRLAELDPQTYFSLEALGICTVDASGEKNVSGMAKLYRGLGKRTFGICDKQDNENEAKIKAEVELLLMHEEKGFENLVIKGTTQAALERFASQLDWPPHILKHYPEPVAQAVDALGEYFAWSKGSWGIADFLAQCSEAETPTWIKEAAKKLKEACVPPPPPAEKVESADANAHPEASVDGID
ncbi:ATP-dependent nuclease [Burkholderia ambifaria]|uniref:ATP-dependent nuclease n=1 Tax=Burkholderia ambifaria TaxID=152480 RepID=UPI001B95A8DB|nr:ATP-binding protein [Burkholderia ambifaria]MBR8175782.1 AAA family ATPase [Burkholderia ambifaria]